MQDWRTRQTGCCTWPTPASARSRSARPRSSSGTRPPVRRAEKGALFGGGGCLVAWPLCAFSSMCRKKMPSGHGSPRSGDWHHVKSSPVTVRAAKSSSLRIDLRFNPGLWRRSTPRRRRRSGRIRSSFPNEGPGSRSSDGRRQIGLFFHRGTTRLNDGLGHLPAIGLALRNPQHDQKQKAQQQGQQASCCRRDAEEAVHGLIRQLQLPAESQVRLRRSIQAASGVWGGGGASEGRGRWRCRWASCGLGSTSTSPGPPGLRNIAPKFHAIFRPVPRSLLQVGGNLLALRGLAAPVQTWLGRDFRGQKRSLP